MAFRMRTICGTHRPDRPGVAAGVFSRRRRSIARLLASRAAGEIKTVIRGATIAEAVSAFARLWRSDEHWSAADKVMKRGK